MKQLTKEQSEAIGNWLLTQYTCKMEQAFLAKFPPSCCDSCADGHTCESEVSVDRIPEETSAEYMDRVATINGRK
jgi:hypothetical protein